MNSLSTRIIYGLYRLALWAAFPILLCYLALRVIRNGGYANRLGERWGWLPLRPDETPRGGIWLHAVSVGEVLATLDLLRQWKRRYPDVPIWVTCSTVAGRTVADEKMASIADGVFYLPFDYPFAIRAFLRTLQPRMLVVTETEIWPNLWRETRRSGRPVVVINGRISDRAAPRYERHAWFFRQVLAQASEILAQSDLDAARYQAAGATDVSVMGNLKWDFEPRAVSLKPDLAIFFEQHRGAKVWVAASTIAAAKPGDPDEDDAVLEAFVRLRQEFPLLLILAPRKPERFDIVAGKLAALNVSWTRRSALRPVTLPGVLLLDSVGELSAVFAHADAVLVGGSLSSHGGHNVLEPLAFHKPVIVGPWMQNFRAIFERLQAAHALRVIRNVDQLIEATRDCLLQTEEVAAMVRRATEVSAAERGATGRALAAMQRGYESAFPLAVTPLWRRALAPLAWLWDRGVRWDQRRQLKAQKRLSKPVVSIGNLSVGGTGKTPLTLALALALEARGIRVGVLTRGYGRESRHTLVVRKGDEFNVRDTGDEAALYIQRGIAAVGIGPDRHRTGMLMEQCVDLYLLDDGYQHQRLYRDLNILLVDVNDPWSGGLLPVGRARESQHAAARAEVVVWTRAARGIDYAPMTADWPALRPTLTLTSRWSEPLVTDSAGSPAAPPENAVAFCGLAEPASFASSLRRLPTKVEAYYVFPDHHRYVPRCFQGWPHLPLLTTAKDAVKLGGLALPGPLYVVHATPQIDGLDDLVERISSLPRL